VSNPLLIRVAADGKLLSSTAEGQVASVEKLGNGRYKIILEVALSGSSILVVTINTIGGTDPGPGSSSIEVGNYDTANHLFVRTSTPSASFPASVDSDRPFSLIVYP
jgi:hypothetical protein